MEQLGMRLRKEVIEEEARFKQVYTRFYVAKVNQLSLRFRQCGPKMKERWKGVGVTSEYYSSHCYLLRGSKYLVWHNITMDQNTFYVET